MNNITTNIVTDHFVGIFIHSSFEDLTGACWIQIFTTAGWFIWTGHILKLIWGSWIIIRTYINLSTWLKLHAALSTSVSLVRAEVLTCIDAILLTLVGHAIRIIISFCKLPTCILKLDFFLFLKSIGLHLLSLKLPVYLICC